MNFKIKFILISQVLIYALGQLYVYDFYEHRLWKCTYLNEEKYWCEEVE